MDHHHGPTRRPGSSVMGKKIKRGVNVARFSSRQGETEVYHKRPLPIAATSWSARGSLREGPASQLKSTSGLLSLASANAQHTRSRQALAI